VKSFIRPFLTKTGEGRFVLKVAAPNPAEERGRQTLKIPGEVRGVPKGCLRLKMSVFLLHIKFTSYEPGIV
jgi:hypothetical protein